MSAEWWIEYITADGGAGGEAVPKIISAATQPKATGNIEWVYGPYKTQAAAQAAMKNGPPSGNPASAQGGITSTGGGSGALIGGSDSLLGNINVGNWLLRIGEVVLGIVLLAIGVAHITRAVPAATKIAKTAGAGALLA